VILDWHTALDKAREEKLRGKAIGTTGRGIGPTYEDKVARRGVRVADLLHPKSLREKLEGLIEFKNFELEKLYGWPKIDVSELFDAAAAFGRDLEPYVDHTGHILDEALRAGKNVLFEGAQGTFLDIDHGTYPYVTSSNCVAGAVCAGSGVGPTRIDRVLGITKAYTTRVGGGPFPTELEDATGERLRKAGSEFGATTGRPRRCGWLDLVMLREAVIVNGITDLAVMKSDVLSGFEELLVATRYRIDGKVVEQFPMTLDELERAEPIYESFPGWTEDISGAKSVDDLPDNARHYIDAIERLVDVQISFLSVGPGRDETITLVDPFSG
jgi:adenylosuccinate synthase